MDAAQFDLLIARTRAFVRGIGMEMEAETERKAQLPQAIWDALKELGTFGWSIPPAYGGSGLNSEQLARAFIELAQGAVAYRVVGGTNAGVGSEALIQDGTEEQKRHYLPRLASGDLLGCLALTEPEAGSDATALKTRGEVQGNGDYMLNGQKCFITLAPIAGLFTIFARTNNAPRGGNGITAFLVERGTPGLSASEPTPMMGQDGAPIGEVYLDNCRVSASQILGGEPGMGFRSVMKALNKQRINLSALATGPAIRMLDEALAYARTRRQFDSAIGEFQLVQAMLAECKVQVEAARALILETARKRDRGEDVTLDVSMCKYFSTEMCSQVADKVIQIFGGTGYVKGRPIERFYRDTRVFRIYEGTSQIHLLNIAKRMMQDEG
ncbi:MAG: acyl-CoA dehydrogenase family protein [Blastomonas sp.]